MLGPKHMANEIAALLEEGLTNGAINLSSIDRYDSSGKQPTGRFATRQVTQEFVENTLEQARRQHWIAKIVRASLPVALGLIAAVYSSDVFVHLDSPGAGAAVAFCVAGAVWAFIALVSPQGGTGSHQKSDKR